MFALNLEAFLEIAARRDGEIEMAKRTVGELDIDIPAIRAKALDQPRPPARYLAGQKARGVDEMTCMGKNEVAALVGLRIVLWFVRGSTRHQHWLEIVCHCVAINRVPVPRLEREQRTDFLPYKLPRKRDARIETPVVADLENEFR